MSKLNINKENIKIKFRESKRYLGITAGVILAIVGSTGAISHFASVDSHVSLEENVVSETTTNPVTTVVTTTAQKTTSKKVTTSLLTTNTTTAGTKAIVSPTIVTTTFTVIQRQPAPPTVEAADPVTTVSTSVSESTSTTTETSSSTTTEETTSTTTATTTTAVTTEETTTTTSEPEANREYTVYKPSTHYVHRNTCHWCTDECYEISTTEGLEARYCTECNPDIEIVTAYQEPTPTLTSLQYVTEEERIYLCNTVAYEYGSDCVPLYDKACVVATVMNRVHDGGWTNGLPSTVYNVLTAPYQYNPVYATPYYSYNVTQSCIDAVEYYFEHQGDFPHYTSFWGDGRYNYFR